MAPPPPPRSIGFSMQAFKRYPEIIPLVSILGAAMVGLSVWSGYALLTKSDVKLRRSELSRWDTIQVDQPQKVSQSVRSQSQLINLHLYCGPLPPGVSNHPRPSPCHEHPNKPPSGP
ncbi:uncharacterized protein LOC126999036 isoform X2 [Eriocheir sinensis]|uniref:uncharacterized protein LOC126999036 isoform X2 n=1 Tax=Eriocheir sinensis TaxID=95602 RepID=UPI0021C5FE0C|nr:uncharacterized protein LOC126999036 isoform X2 [Eriocheir sinensis]XP_050717348.1 uncharacterized protein LOC126999036 isoform X2 [Eriocheir sinensis]